MDQSCKHTHICLQLHKKQCNRFSPYYLLYGRHPLLPIDIEFGVMTPDLNETVTLKYVMELQRILEYAFREAAAFSKKEAQGSKRCYDKFAKSSKLEPGDLVLVRKKGFPGET